MSTATFTIGDLAREFDLTTRAIRFYEDMGLLEPTRSGPGGRNRIYSGREAVGGSGTFLCWSLPVRIRDADPGLGADAWTATPGDVRWYFRDATTGEIAEEPARIADLIRSTAQTPRRLGTPHPELAEARDAVEKHIRNGYLKQVQAPVGVRPVLKAWMELN